jgi:hypothetical protein
MAAPTLVYVRHQFVKIGPSGGTGRTEKGAIMPDERYPGERRGLRLFLEELLPAVERAAAGDEAPPSLLRQAIVRALRTGELLHLRHARQLFNHLPREHRQALSVSMLRPKVRPVPTRDELLDELSRREPAAMVCLETRPSSAAVDGTPPVRVELRHELEASPVAPVRVAIEPGTLPSVAADALRRMAAMLEADRRLLSARFWEREAEAGGGAEQRDAR